MFFELALLGCILQIVQAACVIDIETGTQETTKCKSTKCDVTIGGSQYCSQCSKDDDHLIDGKCVGAGQDSTNNCETPKTGTCTSCKAGYFLHKGGCYLATGAPGNAICSEPSNDAKVCATCAAGYFKNPAAAANKPPCIACDDAAGDGTNKGVADCALCGPPSSSGASNPAICTKCTSPKYLKNDAGATTCIDESNCVTTQNQFFKIADLENGNKCVSCGDTQGAVDGCDTCTYDSSAKKVTCTKCSTNYLKTVDGATTCEADCGAGFFNNNKGGDSSNLKVCSPCAVNCLTCTDGTADKCKSCTAGTHFLVAVADGTQGKCVSCGDTDAGVPNCAKCTAPSTAGQKPTCSACISSYKLEGGACVSTGGVNLSTGAIAGISVAAVVVVGGLVGFLCWWFICRGKA